MVRLMLGFGMPTKRVMNYLNWKRGGGTMSTSTFYRAFRGEIEHAHDETVSMVVGKLLELCLQGNLGAICFWLKNRAGWADNPARGASLTFNPGADTGNVRLEIEFEEAKKPKPDLKVVDGEAKPIPLRRFPAHMLT